MSTTDIIAPLAEPQKLERNPNDPLYKMLKKITDHDADIEDTEVEELVGEIMLDAKEKVDGYFFILTRLDSLAAEQALFAKLHTKRKSNYEAMKREIERKLLRAMQANSFDTFTGHKFQVRLKKNRPAAVPKLSTPDDHHTFQYSEFISTKFAWKLTEIGQALKPLTEDADDETRAAFEKASAIASLESSISVEFSARKDVD